MQRHTTHRIELNQHEITSILLKHFKLDWELEHTSGSAFIRMCHSKPEGPALTLTFNRITELELENDRSA